MVWPTLILIVMVCSCVREVNMDRSFERQYIRSDGYNCLVGLELVPQVIDSFQPIQHGMFSLINHFEFDQVNQVFTSRFWLSQLSLDRLRSGFGLARLVGSGVGLYDVRTMF